MWSSTCSSTVPRMRAPRPSCFQDFEDAVLHESARGAGADGLVTRNPEDFRTATLRVYRPNELLAAVSSLEDDADR